MNLISLFLTLVVGLFIMGGSLCAVSQRNNKKFSDFIISVAFGVIISLSLLEILPESFEILTGEVGVIRGILAIIVLILIGIFSLKTLDLFIPHHEHEAHHHHKHKNEECHDEHLHHVGIISSIAVIIHNIIEGMSLYLIASKDLVSGLLLCIGIGLHNIPMGLIISTTLINSHYSKNKALKLSLIVSLSTFLGGLFMAFMGGVSELVEGILLGLTLGMLIYLSVFELLHQVYHMENKKLSRIGVLVGIVLIVISVVLEHVI